MMKKKVTKIVMIRLKVMMMMMMMMIMMMMMMMMVTITINATKAIRIVIMITITMKITVSRLFLCLTRTTRTPAFWGYPSRPHDYPFYWVILDPKSKEDKVKITNLKNSPKFHIFEYWNKHYTWHTFWSCLIRCGNMQWIRRVLSKIQSGHDLSADGQTDICIAHLI